MTTAQRLLRAHCRSLSLATIELDLPQAAGMAANRAQQAAWDREG